MDDVQHWLTELHRNCNTGDTCHLLRLLRIVQDLRTRGRDMLGGHSHWCVLVLWQQGDHSKEPQHVSHLWCM